MRVHLYSKVDSFSWISYKKKIARLKRTILTVMCDPLVFCGFFFETGWPTYSKIHSGERFFTYPAITTINIFPVYHESSGKKKTESERTMD